MNEGFDWKKEHEQRKKEENILDNSGMISKNDFAKTESKEETKALYGDTMIGYSQVQPYRTYNNGSCIHENVIYCSICGVVYCVRCGKQWYSNYYNGTAYYPPYTYVHIHI
jgi:hypothetical protein